MRDQVVRDAMLLYGVTDRAWLRGRGLSEQVEEALRGGVTCIQLREKDMSESEFLAAAMELREVCRRYGVPFVVNDNVAVAVACGADGIHVGQKDMAVSDVRARIGESMILGVSVQTVEQAVAAVVHGADYLGVGAVFATSTKGDADSVSLSILGEICAAVEVPVCAIGGITAENLSLLAGSGIDGVAVVSAIFAQEDIETACRSLSARARGLRDGKCVF